MQNENKSRQKSNSSVCFYIGMGRSLRVGSPNDRQFSTRSLLGSGVVDDVDG
jgi:hypothetical protein